jgi:hypothetical protein
MAFRQPISTKLKQAMPAKKAAAKPVKKPREKPVRRPPPGDDRRAAVMLQELQTEGAALSAHVGRLLERFS